MIRSWYFHEKAMKCSCNTHDHFLFGIVKLFLLFWCYMLKVYLDTNVIKDISSGLLPELEDLINKNRKRLTIPFSYEHINDKYASRLSHPEKYAKEIADIGDISGWMHLHYAKEEQSFTLKYLNPELISEKNKNRDQEISELFNFSQLFDSVFDEDYEVAGLSDLRVMFENLLNTKLPNSDLTLREDMEKYFQHINDVYFNPEDYGLMIRKSKNHLRLPTDSGKWTENVIKQIDEFLLKNQEMTFQKLVEQSLTTEKSKRDIQLIFKSAYNLLNILGYKSDKITRRKGFPNHNNDAGHVANASYCDVLISRDRNLILKAKAIYEWLSVDTMVLHIDDWMILEKAIKFGKEFQSIYHPSCLIDKNEEGTTVGFTKYPVFGYFNRVVHWFPDSGIEMRFFRDFGLSLGGFHFNELMGILEQFEKSINVEFENKLEIIEFIAKNDEKPRVIVNHDGLLMYFMRNGGNISFFFSIQESPKDDNNS